MPPGSLEVSAGSKETDTVTVTFGPPSTGKFDGYKVKAQNLPSVTKGRSETSHRFESLLPGVMYTIEILAYRGMVESGLKTLTVQMSML